MSENSIMTNEINQYRSVAGFEALADEYLKQKTPNWSDQKLLEKQWKGHHEYWQYSKSNWCHKFKKHCSLLLRWWKTWNK